MNNGPYTSHSTNGSSSPFAQSDSHSHLDPSLAFGNVNPNSLDFSQLQNPLLQQQQLNDGAPRSQPQNFQHPAYNVNSVVPAKRPRATDDNNITASPRTSQGQQGPSSRSQTPQQQQANYANGGFSNQNMSPYPNPYQHIQQQQMQAQAQQHQQSQPGSNHATPSPAPSNQQHFTSGQPPTSNSPVQFNQNIGNFNQMQNRPNASQNPNNPGFPRGVAAQQNSGAQNGVMTDAQRQQQYQLNLQQIQMRQQQQAQQQAQLQLQGNNMVQNRQLAQGMGPGQTAAANMTNGPQANRNAPGQMQTQSRPSQGQSQTQAPGQAKQQRPGEANFMNSLQNFLTQRNINLDPDPKVCGLSINYFSLFQEASRRGVIAQNANQGNWPHVAAAMGFPEDQYPTAAEEMKTLFQRYLMNFSLSWVQMMQKRRMQLIQQQQTQAQQQNQQKQQTPAMPGGPQAQQRSQMSGAGGQQQQMSPSHAAQQLPQGSPPHDAPQPQEPNQIQASAPPVPQSGTPAEGRSLSPQANGMFTNQNQTFSTQGNFTGQPPSAIEISAKVTPATSPDMAIKSSVTPPKRAQADVKAKGLSTPTGRATSQTPSQIPALTEAQDKEPQEPVEEITTFQPKLRLLGLPKHIEPQLAKDPERQDNIYYGGLPIAPLREMGEKLALLKPGVPKFEEMGAVDIHALTMSIQSGLRAEVRYALDQLVGLSSDVRVTIPLHECENLVESLIDCGEEQLAILAESAETTSATSTLPLLEDLTRQIRIDDLRVQDYPPFGSLDFELRHSADRLIAISTILRNLSCPDHLANHEVLASPFCINFVASIIRTMVSHRNLLRNAKNTVDVMKDIVTMLSQIAHRLEIPSEDDALSLLQLLVSFIPAPAPVTGSATRPLAFTPYDPQRHQYLPSAIDALAKLLARDVPNRILFKSVIANEPEASPSDRHKLLTRAFALAIAPIPDRHTKQIEPMRGDLFRLSHVRNHFFSQGMLAADILASLAPGPSDPLARSWLESEDGWAPSLLDMLFQLSKEPTQPGMPRVAPANTSEGSGVKIVTARGLSMLRTLAEKFHSGSESVARPSAAVNGTTIRGATSKDSQSNRLALAGVIPDPDSVLDAVIDSGFDVGALKQLLAFSSVDS